MLDISTTRTRRSNVIAPIYLSRMLTLRSLMVASRPGLNWVTVTPTSNTFSKFNSPSISSQSLSVNGASLSLRGGEIIPRSGSDLMIL